MCVGGKMAQQISTSVSREIYDFVKRNHLHWNQLILSGIQAQRNHENIMQRLHEVEEGNMKLQAKLRFMSEQYLELERRKITVNNQCSVA